MGVWAQGSQFAGYDYVQTSEPVNPEEGETWYDMDTDRALVYTGTQWSEMTVTDHGQLSGVVEGAHHAYPVPTAGLAADAVTTSEIAADAITNALIAADAVDSAQIVTDAITTALIANGAVDTAQIATGAVSINELGFNPTTQSELDTHASDAAAHHDPAAVREAALAQQFVLGGI